MHSRSFGKLRWTAVTLCLAGLAQAQPATTKPTAAKPTPATQTVAAAAFTPAESDPRAGLFQYNNLMWKADTAGMAGWVAAVGDAERKLAAAMIRADAHVGSLLALVRERFGPDAAEDVAKAIGDRTNAHLASAHTLILNADGSHHLTLAGPSSRPNRRTDPLDAYPSDTLDLSADTLAKLSPEERAKVQQILSGKQSAVTRPVAARAGGAGDTGRVGQITTLPSLTIPPRLESDAWVVTIDGREARYEHRGQSLAVVIFAGSDQPSVLRQEGGKWKLDMADLASIAPNNIRPMVDSFLENANRAKVVYQELLSGGLKSPAEVSHRIESIK